MASSMPNFVARLFRPFTSSARMSLNPEGRSTADFPANAQKCTVAAGCFWGVEHLFRKTFEGKGLLDARVGYIGGDMSSPSYRAVCSGRTGRGFAQFIYVLVDALAAYVHGIGISADDDAIILDAESLQMTFDPSLLPYATLLEFFYKMHDPTTPNRQGMDTGTQYRSAIFYHSPEQKAEAERVTVKAQEQWWKQGRISTEILEAGQWWDAEDYHQLYLHNNPGGYECPAHFVRKFPDLV